jgi:hypothetical protein
MRLHSREKRLLASSCSSVRPPACRSFHLYQLGFDGTDFHEKLCWKLSFKFVIKIQICLQSDKNIGRIICRLKYVFLLSATLNHRKSSVLAKWHQAVINSRGGINITRTRRSVTVSIRCLCSCCYYCLAERISLRFPIFMPLCPHLDGGIDLEHRVKST